MASSLKPIKIWGKEGPNPSKVAIILRELAIPHETIPYQIQDAKKPKYVAVNPNGRLPAIEDPNTNVTLWESGAIIEYLIERYDTQARLNFASGTVESYHAKQWLFFQTTGQGPYFGQLVHFKKFHSEQLPSAIERYAKEVSRVTGVIEGHLAQQKKEYANSAGNDGPWLVGNKLSYADLAFVPYQKVIGMFLTKDEYNPDNYPSVKEWLGRMSSRESVKDVFGE